MDNQQNFIDQAKAIESKQKELIDLHERLKDTMAALGVGTYVQDPATSTVYKIVKPKGTFMYFKDIDYVRTAIQDERSGSLSKKEAEEAGFTVLKK